MIRLNAPKGLGDAIHVRAVVIHLLRQGELVTVFTRWPEVFADLDISVRPADEARQYDDVTSARACLQCIVPYIRNLSLFRNVCLQAGIIDVVDPNIGWTVRNRALVDVVKTLADRPILIFQSLKIVANEEDKQRRPDGEAFRRLINGHREHFKVKLGHSQFVQDDADLACDLDLFDKLTVTDAIDLVKIADVVCSEPSYLTILGQAFSTKVECLFSVRGLRSNIKSVAGITPERLFHNKHRATAFYDE